MRSRLAFHYAFQQNPGSDLGATGKALGEQLLGGIREQPYPPILLLLFATPDFQDYDRFLAGVRSVRDDRADLSGVPLVGCSVTACLLKEGLHQCGAVLVGICSDAIEVRTAVAENAADNPEAAVSGVLEKLTLADWGSDFNPDGNRLALMFLPGFKARSGPQSLYSDPELHCRFCEATNFEIPVVGGSASSRLGDRAQAWHFHNDRVYRNAMAVALLECDVKHGAAMGAKLRETEKFVHVKEFDENDHCTIRSFHEKGTPFSHVANRPHSAVFGVMNANGDPTILYPVEDADETIWLARGIGVHRRFQILEFDREEAIQTAGWVLDSGIKRQGLVPSDVAGALAFVCSARLQLFQDDREWIETAFRTACEKVGDAPVVAVYLNGECGPESSGRLAHNNMQIAGLVFGKTLSTAAQARRGSKALAEASKAMLDAKTVQETADCALKGLDASGFAGGMLSLIYEEGTGHGETKGWIVAQGALGDRWKNIVSLTRREIGGSDVLAQVCAARSPRFVPDARLETFDCEPQAVGIARVVSQYIAPLMSEKDVVIGVLQVDLGDLSHLQKLPDSLDFFLRSYANHVGAALARAMYLEQVEIARQLDKATAESLVCRTLNEAADKFLQALAEAFGVEMAHLRVLSPSGRYLEMIGSVGEYGERARAGPRKRISVNDEGPSATCFRKYGPDEVMVVNNAAGDPRASHLHSVYAEGTPVGDALRRLGAFANTVVFGEAPNRRKLGVLNIATREPWCFAQHKMDALRDAGRRSAFLIASLIAIQKRVKEIEFLNAAIPRIQAFRDAPDALHYLASKLARACHAEIVSIFRWDEERNVLVLAAEHGWCEPMVGQAIYARGEGMTGSLVDTGEVSVVEDRNVIRKRIGRAAKYPGEMAGPLKEGQTFELIGFRLQILGKLHGVVALYNLISNDEVGDSHFTTTDRNVLGQLQVGLSMWMYSLVAMEQERRHVRDEACLAELGRDLLQPGKLERVLERALTGLAGRRGVEAIGVLLREGQELDKVKLLAGYGHPETVAGETFERGESPVVEPLVTQQPVTLVCTPHMRTIPLKYSKEFARVLPSREVKSYLAVPLTVENERLGVLSLINLRSSEPAGRYITRDSVDFFQRVADRIATFLKMRQIRQLRTEREKAAENLVAMGVAAGVAFHAVGSRLSNVVALSDELLEGQGQVEPHKLLSDIGEYAREGLLRLRTFLDYVEGVESRETTDASLLKLVEVVLARHTRALLRKNVRVAREIRCDLQVRVCPPEIIEIVEIIVKNAADAMIHGGVLTVGMGYDRHSGNGTLSLTDTGRGMTSDQMERVFEGFFSGKSHGFGFGLKIARALASRNEAQLSLRHALPQGIAVVLRIPAKRLEVRA